MDQAQLDKILKVGTEETEFTTFLRCYTSDIEGRRVLVGLDYQETQEYLGLKRKSLTDDFSKSARVYSSVEERRACQKREIELYEKHERARLQVLGAEIALNNGATVN